MIAYLKGKLIYKGRTEVVVEVGGVGYLVHVSLNTYDKIAHLQDVTLLISYIVREDAHLLFGFAEPDEKAMFEQLISVSGVGTNTARLMLSSMTAEQLRHAIIGENVQALRGIKGIGPKSAARIVLELKDKLLRDSGAASEAIAAGLMADNPVREEALAALLALGFNRAEIQKALNRLLKERDQWRDSGELIKQALGLLAGG